MPDDTPDFMAPAWFGCLHWAAGNPEILARFERETGFKWTPGSSPLERAIDDACGMPEKFYDAFVAWVKREPVGNAEWRGT